MKSRPDRISAPAFLSMDYSVVAVGVGVDTCAGDEPADILSSNPGDESTHSIRGTSYTHLACTSSILGQWVLRVL